MSMNHPSEPMARSLQLTQPAAFEDDEIDLRDLLGILMAGRWLLVLVALLVLSLGVLYAWVSPRIYSADALVQVETERKTLNAAALGEMAELLGTETPVTAEIEILKSRMVLGQVVDELNLTLQASPSYFPVFGLPLARHLAPGTTGDVADAPMGMRRFAWGGEKIRITDFRVADSYRGLPFFLRVLDGGRYALRDEEGRIVAEGVVGQRAEFQLDGEPAALFVQELIGARGTEFEIANQRRADVITGLEQSFRVAERGKQSGILQLTLEGRDRALVTQTLNKVAEVYLRQNVERKSAEAEQTLAFLSQQLPQLRKDVENAESAINAYRLKQGSADLTKETDLILQQAVTLEQTRFELEQKREEALRRFTSSHPVVQAINSQLSQIDQERRTIDDKVKNLPETQQELLRLSRDLEVNSALYLSLLNNAQELQVVKAGTVGNVRIIDQAVVPTRPAKPKVALVLALSLVLGAMLGVAAVFVRRALHSGVEDPAEVENKLGLATYCTVPYSSPQARIRRMLKRGEGGGERLLAIADPNGNAIEALRSLRTALHFGQLEAKNNVVMLTGPSPELGKSFVSANLGAVLAMSGKRVAVVDMDLRRGHLHEYFDVARAPGVTDFVAGTAAIADVLYASRIDGLHFVPTGTIPPNPAELVLSDRIGELLGYLSKKYDTVIVDTPPVLAVTDAAVVGRYAGTTLIVLKAGEHSLRMIEDTVKRLQAAGIAVRGTIFNQVGLSGRGRYSYKYGYSYGYYSYNYAPKAGK